MDRCALFVDAGYLLADGAMAVHGTRHRETVSWDFGGLLQLLGNLARERTGLPLLRCYWYEATVEGRRGPEHEALADLPGVKLRLGRIRPGRREGVDSEIHRDLMTLARNGALADAVVVSGDEDISQIVLDAQDFGVRVTILHVATDGNWTISRSLRQECDDLIEIGPGHLRPYVSVLAGESPAIAAPTGSGTGAGAIGALGAGSVPTAAPLSNGHGSGSSIGPLHGTGSHNSPPPSTPLTGPLSPAEQPAPSGTGSGPGLGSGLGSGSAYGSAYGSDTGSGYGLSAGSGSGYDTGSNPGFGTGTGDSRGGYGLGTTGSGYGSPSNPGLGPGATNSDLGHSGLNGSNSGLDTGANPLPGTGLGMGTGANPLPGTVPGTGTGANPLPGAGNGIGSNGSGASQLPPLSSSPLHAAPTSSPSTTGPLSGPSTTGPLSGPSVTGPATAAPPPQTGSGPQYLPPTPPQQQPPVRPSGPYTGPQQVSPIPAVQQNSPTLADAVKAAHQEGQDFGESVARDAPALWLEAVLARKPRMPSDLEARLLQGSSLPIDFLLHDEVRHALRRGFWDALERSRR
ncbi:hypothetical protein GCM10010191_48040 [Actinomadura vinacea]|uniref:NYN domain-containing protein n=1 Tax=Actinomadura vinacea TaxID=115336 RepID=A0ABN3JGI0_9ACTN